jgi:hypothetical protein
VLVKLSMEPPDLTVLPGELDGIGTARLARSPGQRPTSAALLDQLGPFAATPGGPRSAHAYLPAPAMAVISAYQHGPRQAVRAPAGADAPGTTGRAHGEIGRGGEDASGDGAEATSGSTGAERTRRRSARRRRCRRRPRVSARSRGPGPRADRGRLVRPQADKAGTGAGSP